MKKLLVLTLLLVSCYDVSIRHKIQQDWSYFEIPEERITLTGEWDYKSECYYFYDTIYTHIQRQDNSDVLVTKGFYYVTVDDTVLFLLSPNRTGAVTYKVSLQTDSMLIYINDSIYLSFINKNYVRETN